MLSASASVSSGWAPRARSLPVLTINRTASSIAQYSQIRNSSWSMGDLPWCVVTQGIAHFCAHHRCLAAGDNRQPVTPKNSWFGFVWSAVGVIVDGVLLFGVLPGATGFPTLVLALAPPYIIGGVLVSMPATANSGRAFTANGATLLALQDAYE